MYGEHPDSTPGMDMAMMASDMAGSGWGGDPATAAPVDTEKKKKKKKKKKSLKKKEADGNAEEEVMSVFLRCC